MVSDYAYAQNYLKVTHVVPTSFKQIVTAHL